MSNNDPESLNKLKKILEETDAGRLDNIVNSGKNSAKDSKLLFESVNKAGKFEDVKSRGQVSVTGKVCSLADAPQAKSDVKVSN